MYTLYLLQGKLLHCNAIQFLLQRNVLPASAVALIWLKYAQQDYIILQRQVASKY